MFALPAGKQVSLKQRSWGLCHTKCELFVLYLSGTKAQCWRYVFFVFFVILIVDGNDELKMILTMVEGWMGWLVVMLCTVASPVPSTRTYDSYVSSIALIDGLHMKCIRA